MAALTRIRFLLDDDILVRWLRSSSPFSVRTLADNGISVPFSSLLLPFGQFDEVIPVFPATYHRL